MPYIKKDDRENFELALHYLSDNPPTSAGELNYLFTRLYKIYINAVGLKYQTINDIVGALEGCKLELTRRVTNNYEDKKIAENGDV